MNTQTHKYYMINAVPCKFIPVAPGTCLLPRINEFRFHTWTSFSTHFGRIGVIFTRFLLALTKPPISMKMIAAVVILICSVSLEFNHQYYLLEIKFSWLIKATSSALKKTNERVVPFTISTAHWTDAEAVRKWVLLEMSVLVVHSRTGSKRSIA